MRGSRRSARRLSSICCFVKRRRPGGPRIRSSSCSPCSCTLQDDDGSYEAALGTMHEVLPPAMVAFLVPDGSEWDAPVIGPAFHPAPIPGPDVYNLRARRTGKPQLPTSEPPIAKF